MKFSAIGIAVGAALLVLALAAKRGPPPAASRRERGNDAARGRFIRRKTVCRSVTYVTAGAVTPCINKNLTRREKREVGLWSKEDWRDG